MTKRTLLSASVRESMQLPFFIIFTIHYRMELWMAAIGKN